MNVLSLLAFEYQRQLSPSQRRASLVPSHQLCIRICSLPIVAGQRAGTFYSCFYC
jgi:hypothetical protein